MTPSWARYSYRKRREGEMKIVAHVPTDWLIARIGMPKDSIIHAVRLNDGHIEVTISSASIKFDADGARGWVGSPGDASEG